MKEEKKQENLLKRFGKWGPIVGVAWIAINIIVPLTILRIPLVQKYLIALENKLPFDIPGIG